VCEEDLLQPCKPKINLGCQKAQIFLQPRKGWTRFKMREPAKRSSSARAIITHCVCVAEAALYVRLLCHQRHRWEAIAGLLPQPNQDKCPSTRQGFHASLHGKIHNFRPGSPNARCNRMWCSIECTPGYEGIISGEVWFIG